MKIISNLYFYNKPNFQKGEGRIKKFSDLQGTQFLLLEHVLQQNKGANQKKRKKEEAYSALSQNSGKKSQSYSDEDGLESKSLVKVQRTQNSGRENPTRRLTGIHYLDD